MAGSGAFEFQAAPDVEIFIRITKGQEVMDELEANINISRTVLELKQSLSKPLNLEVQDMVIYKNGVQLEDVRTLMDYEVSTDDTLTVQDISS